ncbi:MAG: HAMP domain-containing histidine kinase [Paramuribaculum sp.]|nr:HAMP domain-containing histidine kinase [Paramuribaculum sp.]
MASKRRFSYQWRQFLPVLGLTWTAVILFFVYFYNRELEAQTTIYRNHLEFICERILVACQNDEDVMRFANFTSRYFETSQFSEMKVYVYDSQSGKLLYNIGTSTLQDYSDAAPLPEFRDAELTGRGEAVRKADEEMNLSIIKRSDDGKYFVHATVPFNVPFKDLFGKKSFWPLILLIVAASVISYLSTLLLTRNVTLLRDFAQKAADGNVDYDTSKFPHDELGDISREIIKIYQEKDAAVSKSEKEHKIAINAIEEKARVKKQLTNNINHELKTPIGVIRGYLETIRTNPDMDDATRNHFLNRTYENVERLCNLLTDVGAITLLEDGAKNIPVSEVDFHDLVFTIEHDLRISGGAGNMKFNYDIPLNCYVKGNTNLLIGLISNLIKNAAQYSHGTEMGIKLIMDSEKHYTFSFYDNGVGVDPEHLPHLFERFYRIDAGRSRKSGGTGLGLPIVKNTIEALGGSISVHNRTEGGLEYLFTLEKWKPNLNNC